MTVEVDGTRLTSEAAWVTISNVPSYGGPLVFTPRARPDNQSFEVMIQHARQFAELDIPFIFDPGQGMPLFDGDDLLRFLEQASWATLNDYEAELMQQRTGKSLAQLAGYVQALIVTLGAQGSKIYVGRLIMTYEPHCLI